MQLAFLWYETFKGCLEEIGFKINPYDPCVANKNTNGDQCTICWYVDDTKISHKDSKVVDSIISSIEDKFVKMTVTRGNKHTFIVVDIEFTKTGMVILSMEKYIEECIKTYDEHITNQRQRQQRAHCLMKIIKIEQSA